MSGSPAASAAAHARPIRAVVVDYLILVGDVDYIAASGVCAELHVGGRQYVIREAMQTLEERLDPAQFIRVHRSVIVRPALVESRRRAHRVLA